MVFNHITIKNITQRDKDLFTAVTNIIYRLHDVLTPQQNLIKMEYRNFNCHVICRAISFYIPELHTITGSYVGLEQKRENGTLTMEPTWSQHSWLLTPDDAVIDPHPVGVISVSPLLAVGKGDHTPYGKGLYVPDWDITKKVSGRNLWRKSTLLRDHIKKIMG